MVVSSNVRMKSRCDATRPKTHIRLLDGQTTEWCWAMWKFPSSRENVWQSFYLALCSLRSCFAISLSLSLDISITFAHFFSPHLSIIALPFTQSLIFTLNCLVALRFIPWCFPSSSSLAGPLSMCHLVSVCWNGNAFAGEKKRRVTDWGPCGVTLFVVTLSISLSPFSVLSFSLCMFRALSDFQWMNEWMLCKYIVFHSDSIPTLIPMSCTIKLSVTIESLFFLWCAHFVLHSNYSAYSVYYGIRINYEKHVSHFKHLIASSPFKCGTIFAKPTNFE